MPSFGLTGLSGLSSGLTEGFGTGLDYATQLARKRAAEQQYIDQQQGLELAGQAFQHLFPGATAQPLGPQQSANLRPPQPGGMPGMTPMPSQASVPGPTAGPPEPPGAQAGGFQGPVPPGGMIPGGGIPTSFQVDNQPPQPYPGQPGAPPIPPSPAISPPTQPDGGAVPASQPGAAGPPGGVTPPQGGPQTGMTGLDDAIRAIREANPKATGKQIMQALQFMQPQLNYEGKVELAEMRSELMAAKTKAEFDTKIHQFETSLLRAQIGAQAKTDVAEIAARAGIEKSRISAEAKVTAADQAAWARVESAKVNKDAKVEAADLQAWARVEAAKTAGEYKVEAAGVTGAAGVEKAKIGAEAGIERAKIKAGSALDVANVQASTKEKLARLTDARIRELATNKQAFDIFMQGLKGENRLEVAKTIGAMRSEQQKANIVSRENIAAAARAAAGERQDKAIAAAGERQDKAIAAQGERQDKYIAAANERLDKSLGTKSEWLGFRREALAENLARRDRDYELRRQKVLPGTEDLVKRAERLAFNTDMLKDEAETFAQTGKFSDRVNKLSPQDRAAVTTAIRKLAQDEGSTTATRIQNIQKNAAQGQAYKEYIRPGSPINREIRSLSTIQEHFKTLRQLVDTWNPSDYPIFNKFAAWWATQTGSPAPANLDEAAKFVGSEILNAIGVRAGGTGKEREEAAAAFMASGPQAKGLYDLAVKLASGQGGKTHEQLYGAIETAEKLINGRLLTVRQGYEFGTGRKDFNAMLSEQAQKRMEEIKKGIQVKPGTSGSKATPRHTYPEFNVINPVYDPTKTAPQYLGPE